MVTASKAVFWLSVYCGYANSAFHLIGVDT